MGRAQRAAVDHSPTIFLVEDDSAIRDLVSEFLADLGYRVLCAASVDAALRLLEEGDEIDLLLTDIGLPDGNGFTVARQAQQSRPHLKIIYASAGLAGGNWLQSDARLGTFLAKPFRLSDLRHHIEAALNA